MQNLRNRSKSYLDLTHAHVHTLTTHTCNHMCHNWLHIFTHIRMVDLSMEDNSQIGHCAHWCLKHRAYPMDHSSMTTSSMIQNPQATNIPLPNPYIWSQTLKQLSVAITWDSQSLDNVTYLRKNSEILGRSGAELHVWHLHNSLWANLCSILMSWPGRDRFSKMEEIIHAIAITQKYIKSIWKTVEDQFRTFKPIAIS